MTNHGSQESVDTLARFELNGTSHWTLVRGRSRTNPLLLLVQAGPGFPMIHEARLLERHLRLEERFRVVYWDQRGTGKSLERSTDKGPLHLDQLVEDLRALVLALCERFEVAQVYLTGFSLGASLAAIAAAQNPKPIHSVVAVGLDVDFLESERFAYTFALDEATRRGNGRALRELKAIGEPPHDDSKRFLTRVKWVSNFGGIHRHLTFAGFVRGNVLRLLGSPHYSMREVIGAIRAMTETQQRLLGNLQGFDLFACAPRIETPITLFHGRHDVAAPPHIAERYFERLDAPRKALVWFEDSAHMPHLEESARFREALLQATGLEPGGTVFRVHGVSKW